MIDVLPRVAADWPVLTAAVRRQLSIWSGIVFCGDCVGLVFPFSAGAAGMLLIAFI